MGTRCPRLRRSHKRRPCRAIGLEVTIAPAGGLGGQTRLLSPQRAPGLSPHPAAPSGQQTRARTRLYHPERRRVTEGLRLGPRDARGHPQSRLRALSPGPL